MLVTFATLIPLTRNGNSLVTDVEQEAILKQFIDAFGSLTIEGRVVGAWKETSTGKTVQDLSLKIAVGCPWNRAAEFERLILAIGKQLGQKEMFVEVRSGTGSQSLRCDGPPPG